VKLEVRRAKALKGEFRLPPDRTQAQVSALLSLLAPGRTLLRGWQSSPEWEHVREWLAGIGAVANLDAEGLVVGPGPDLRERTEFVIDPFLPAGDGFRHALPGGRVFLGRSARGGGPYAPIRAADLGLEGRAARSGMGGPGQGSGRDAPVGVPWTHPALAGAGLSGKSFPAGLDAGRTCVSRGP
jgi:hypothetical protein